jgi:hypothetical protein
MTRAAHPFSRSRARFHSSLIFGLALLALLALLVPACVAAPSDAAHLSRENPLDQRSEQGLVEATVALETAELSRGPNDFLITLHATAGDAAASDVAPQLTSVEAVMAAHGHHAGAPSIVTDANGAFRVEQLDLFMSGRWQVTLGVELEARSDSVDFALDVP